MVWYKLKVGLFDLKYTPLKAETKEFPYCDKDGNILKKVINRGTSHFIDDKGNKQVKSYRLIKGKAMDKLSKTKEVSKYIEVNNKEVEDLLAEKIYFVDCPLLFNELKESGKALKFAFTNGNGFKVFKAYIHLSKLYPNMLFMSLGLAQKSELLNSIKEQLSTQNKKQIEISVSEVDKASVEDLLEITA
jgi:predicted XRE-type DNA-binding protein